VLLRHLLDQGLKKTTIARQLGISRRLVYHLIDTGQLDRDLTEPLPARTRAPRPSKLVPYHEIITTRLATYPALSAVRLFAECQAAGYAAASRSANGSCAPSARSPSRSPPCPSRPRPATRGVWSLTISSSRGGSAPPSWSCSRIRVSSGSLLFTQDDGRVDRGAGGGVSHLGGVPAELLFDQLKAVIVDDHRANGGKLLEQR